MAPVPRVIHLVGMSVFGVAHAILRTILIFAMAAPFFHIDVASADWDRRVLCARGGKRQRHRTGHPCRNTSPAVPGAWPPDVLHVQAAVLLVSGVYYSVDVLPAWLRSVSYLSPATYMLDGIRGALLDGAGCGRNGSDSGNPSHIRRVLHPV